MKQADSVLTANKYTEFDKALLYERDRKQIRNAYFWSNKRCCHRRKHMIDLFVVLI